MIMNSRAIFHRRLVLLGAVVGLVLAGENLVSATQAVASFTGSVTTPPQVDATNFNNTATWTIDTGTAPYRTANTLNYYNNGSMTGSIGWDFGWAPSTVGIRLTCATFTNGNNGVITANDYNPYGSLLLVNATNVVSKGLLSAGVAGKLQLSGVNLLLARSKLEIQALTSTGGGQSLNGTNFSSDVGIYDQGWLVGTNNFYPFGLISSYSDVVTTTNVAVTNTTGLFVDKSAVKSVNVTIGSWPYTNVFTYTNLSYTNILSGTSLTYYSPLPVVVNNFATNAQSGILASNVLMVTNIISDTTVTNARNLSGIVKYTTNYFNSLTNLTVVPVVAQMFTAPPNINHLNVPCGGIGALPFGGATGFYLSPTNTYTNDVSAQIAPYLPFGNYCDWVSSFDPIKSNFVVQVVFVRAGDPNISATIHFADSSIPTNVAKTVSVSLQSSVADPITLQTSALYFDDTVLSEKPSGLVADRQQNLVSSCTGTTYRPANYALSRAASSYYLNGSPGNGTLTNNILTKEGFFVDVVQPQFANTNVDGLKLGNGFNGSQSCNLTAYESYVDNLAAEPPPTTVSSAANFPGTIRLYATNLDLNLTRIKSEGALIVQAANLTPASTNSVVDCQNLSYDLGSTNGFLHFQNLAKPSVNRLRGTISVASTVWSDTFTNTDSATFTNTLPVTFHVMILDASQLSSSVPVTVYDLRLHATNLLVSDQMTVLQSLLLDGKAFTLDAAGGLTLGAYLPTLTYTNMPNLRWFTNNGTISLSDNAHFGDDGPSPLAAFVNTGTITSSGQAVNADYAELDGINEAGASGELDVTCRTGIVNGGNGGYLDAGANVQFFANNLVISNFAQLYAAGMLNFYVTNNLSDGGIYDYNYYSCYDGFNMPIKPATGDLLGTEIQSTITGGAQVDHVWAGHDYGRNAVGYLNNAALYQLTLTADPTQFPLFNFVGASSQNAIYVDVLDVSSLGANYADCLQMAPNMVIYYNQAIGDASLTTDAAANPGLLGGHLIWMGSVQGTTNVIFGAQSTPPYSVNGLKLTVAGEQFPYGLDTLPCVIQGNTNLIQTSGWVDVYTGTPPFNFTAPVSTNIPAQFYRAKF
jgi:hypothetical protein